MSRLADRIRTMRNQAGSSLAVSMIMLVVLMAMGVGAMVVSNTQFRMATNLQFQNLALSNAESALAQAENWIATNFEHANLQTRVSGGLYPNGVAVPDANSVEWDDSNSVAVDLFGTQRYRIEVLGNQRNQAKASFKVCDPYKSPVPCSFVNLYRITARGTSARGAAKIVQSVYAVRLNS